MRIQKWDKKDITILDITEMKEEAVKNALLASNGGTIFIVCNDILFGTVSADIFQYWNKNIDIKKYCNTNCYIYEGQQVKEQIAKILSSNIYAAMIPIIDKNGYLKGAYSCMDDTWLFDRENALDYFDFLNRHHIDMNSYFKKNNYYKVAFWGINKVSLSMASDIQNGGVRSVQVIGIFDNICNKINGKDNLLNYETDVYYINSLKELSSYNIDILLIADWRFRHLRDLPNIRKVVYFNKLLKNDFKKYIASALKEQLWESGVDVYSVRIPTKEELGISAKTEMNLEQRLLWFEEETGLPAHSKEMTEFNQERHDLAKKERKANGSCYFGDMSGKYFNYHQKHRIVLNNPVDFENTVYLIGPCIVSGLFNRDESTLGYFLQAELGNNNNTKYRTIPYGIPNDADRYYFYKLLDEIEFREGDKVYWLEQSFRLSDFDIDLLPEFKEAYEEYGHNFYYDLVVHCGKKVLVKCAKKLYQHVINSPQRNSVKLSNKSSIDIEKNNYSGNLELRAYKNFIKKEAIHVCPKIGAIVMNCNPFTLGHQYLIEYASEHVDYLYIFVVEEDKSFFKFEDRISLVRQGTSHLPNVKVLPSGKFIISSNTFSEYFDKANLQGTIVDTSLDVEIFATQIAPILDISVRFVGEEPLDPVTNQYNLSMKQILPKYGIELKEIPRRQVNGDVISASKVRQCLDKKLWDEVKLMVPISTYDFLTEKYS